MDVDEYRIPHTFINHIICIRTMSPSAPFPELPRRSLRISSPEAVANLVPRHHLCRQHRQHRQHRQRRQRRWAKR